MTEPQNYNNHVKLDPLFHFFASPLLLLCVVIGIALSVIELQAGVSIASVLRSIWYLAFPLGVLALGMKARMYPLKVQDRVIAVEVERRYERLGGRANAPLAEKLKPSQLVGLRFASDEELVALADRAAAENLPSKSIKQAVRNWRADHRRI